MTRPQRSPEVSAEIESTKSFIVKASSTRQPVAQFLNNRPYRRDEYDPQLVGTEVNALNVAILSDL
ncbi:hypothetical protein DPX16_12905 [Anabarilius grahami]|uniref:Uncharacterized protein n=1 Tax=Anabarilius grahami TaxID=495550 RepID=A0A3N0XDD9_ANAGA|nr:hypothetical protein DPX16_12905 [Anabarilius grahami]